MKITSMFQVLVFFVVLLTFSTPFITIAQQNPEVADADQSVEAQATQDAEKDVEASINKPMWFIIGCLFPGFGLLTPYIYKPPVPSGKVIGKSPEYVAFYTDAYKAKMEQLQFRYALNGCITSVIAQGCLGVCLIGLSGASD